MHRTPGWALPTYVWVTSTVGIALAQTNPCQATQAVSTLGSALVAQAEIVYDPNQSVCWLANANLAGDANMRASLGVSGINPNGTMDYATALRWVAALNAYNGGTGYLGHNNWQLPSAPLVDHTCADTGTYGGSFGPQCTGSALGDLYSTGLKQTFPASVAPGLAGAAAPLHNLKASYYWAAQNNGGTSGTSNGGQETFSFANGIQGGNTINDTYFYVLPLVAGAIGTPPSCPPGGAAVVPYTSGAAAGSAVYDCNTGYTWPADANLAGSNQFGITGNLTISDGAHMITAPKISGGAMLFQTATQWIQALNTNWYLSSAAWQMPATSKALQDLFTDLNLAAGDTRLMWTGSLGPFQNLQPFFLLLGVPARPIGEQPVAVYRLRSGGRIVAAAVELQLRLRIPADQFADSEVFRDGLLSGEHASGTAGLSGCQRRGRRAHNRAEYVGGNQRHQPGACGRHADLAGFGFCRQPNAHAA